jgi:hypothetical protein
MISVRYKYRYSDTVRHIMAQKAHTKWQNNLQKIHQETQDEIKAGDFSK